MPKAYFLLFSFEGSILHKKAAKDKFFWARRKARSRSRRLRRVPTTTHRKIWTSWIRRRWLGGPPVPIPNTEVKHPYAESTWLETAREARELPVYSRTFCPAPDSLIAQSVEQSAVNRSVVGSSPTQGAMLFSGGKGCFMTARSLGYSQVGQGTGL